jgi:hypothetical protein
MNDKFWDIFKTTGTHPALHPTLAALTIVLQTDDDLSNIQRSHPLLERHSFYKVEAKFDDDISGYLPGAAQRWWECLGKS